MSDKTIDLLRSSERIAIEKASEGRANIQILFDATSLLTWKQRQAIDNFLIGYLSGMVPKSDWSEAVEYAFKAVQKYYAEEGR